MWSTGHRFDVLGDLLTSNAPMSEKIKLLLLIMMLLTLRLYWYQQMQSLIRF